MSYRDGEDYEGGGGGGGGYQNAEEGGKDKKKPKVNQACHAVTIRQVLTAEKVEEAWKVDGEEVSTVVVVGCIFEIAEKSTSIGYKITDGSGAIVVNSWTSSEQQSEVQLDRRAKMQTSTYVRCAGAIRDYQGRKTINAFDLSPITDMNELTHHFLECISTHLLLTKGPPPDEGGSGGGAVSHSQEAAPGFGMYGGGAGAGVGFQVSGMRASSGTGSYAPLGAVAASMDVNQVQDAVLKEFQKCEDSTGLSIRTVITALKGRISQEQVKDAVSFLTTEGHLYSTIDDEHFKSTA